MAMQVEPMPLTRYPTGSFVMGPGDAGLLNLGSSVRRIPDAPGRSVKTSFSPPVAAGGGPIAAALATTVHDDRTGQTAVHGEHREHVLRAGADDVGLVAHDELVR